MTRWDVADTDVMSWRGIVAGLLITLPIWLLVGTGWLWLPALLRTVGI